MSPHRTHGLTRSLYGLWPILLGWLVIAAPGAACEKAQSIELMTDNDLFTSNETDDDLYTFAFQLKIRAGAYAVILHENNFTNRLTGQRFDETYLSFEREHSSQHIPGLHYGWQIGAAHVGHGLFGQNAQNFIHRLIDDSEVEFQYPSASRVYLSWASMRAGNSGLLHGAA